MLKLWPLSQTGRLNREPTCCFDITRQTKAVERVPAATRRLFSFVGILGIPHLGDVVIRLIDYWARSDDTSGHPTGEVRRPRPWLNERTPFRLKSTTRHVVFKQQVGRRSIDIGRRASSQIVGYALALRNACIEFGDLFEILKR